MKEISNCSKTSHGSLFDMRPRSKVAFMKKKGLDLYKRDENNAIGR